MPTNDWGPLDYDKDIQIIPPGNYFLWDDCTIGIKCACGQDVVLDSQNENSECECGKIFRLLTRIEVKHADKN